MPRTKRNSADIAPDADNPLNVAVSRRDGSVLQTVGRALDAGEVMLAFQPVMQTRAPGDVAFYEGLVRVLDETGRVVPARDFIATAEDTELGRKLDCQALRLGLQALLRHPELRLAINMSARSIGYKRWRQILDRFLARHKDVGNRLILEITEASAMTLPEIVSGFMSELQGTGICFALDDFGAGPVSLRYLKDFYFDAVKIDGQFVRGVHASADNQVIVTALIAVARQFDLLTIAENVEDRADAEVLQQMGVDCMQGYLFGAPSVLPPWLPRTASA